MSPLLDAQGVTVQYGGVVALDGVDFSADERAITGLVGPNGAGKTTLFGVLSGLVRPKAGTIALEGTDITRSSPQKRSRLGLARTFQRLELFGEMTVREHLVVARRVRQRRDRFLLRDLIGLGNRPSAGEDEAVDATLELLDLTDVADAPVVLLPLGTARIVELARALATEPRVVLLDEPMSGLDVHETAQIADALRTARDERGVAFVIVEHDVELVLEISAQITVLDFGRVIARGDPTAIRASDEVQAAYLGSASAESAESSESGESAASAEVDTP